MCDISANRSLAVSTSSMHWEARPGDGTLRTVVRSTSQLCVACCCSLGTLAVSYLYQKTWESSAGGSLCHHMPRLLYLSCSSPRGILVALYFNAFPCHLSHKIWWERPSFTCRRSSSDPLHRMQTAPEEVRLTQRSISRSEPTPSKSPVLTPTPASCEYFRFHHGTSLPLSQQSSHK